ncbi:uncharacterized protein LOC141592472 [Silene latifolia]|uniref:uncharacterized protein LOC141592472 n=1 Tax=Silene latifolia TaxID=37657 RepID=UPI003D7828FE
MNPEVQLEMEEAMNPEVADTTPIITDINNLTIKPKSQKSRNNTKIKDVSGSSRATRFVPRDIHMAKILHLLRVDVDAIDDKVNGNARQKKGLAKVDRNWITQFLTVDWSNAFNEEGHVRVTHVMHMLPKLTNRPDAHTSLWISYRRLESAALGLADYNRRNEGAEYYLVKPINAQPARRERKYVSHANFLAKRKNDPEAPLELFYAEVLYSSDDVTICCRLEPRLFPPDISPPLENVKFKRARVIHPEGFSCFTCDRQCRRYL